ncbi:MAG: ATP-binding cassette domain-containing protein, partial [Nanoarchaeota archaeon]|nr:ATP-binding cassette domain-containing protein [Nanoarchaeota archaeon]
IGKTSFVKILAGVVEKDSGELNETIKVSYKPQYLESSDDLVINVLQESVKKYDTQLINPLDIKPLLMKPLNELSGGELQRVAIAACLGREAQLYLLDEPSAYLDVEQRLLVAKIVREFMEHKGSSALIVDHDLLFIDNLSERLIVFNGEPAVNGDAKGPFSMKDGMNIFLKDLNITVRRDHDSGRPRINKEESVKDREQKSKGELYYTSG